MELQNELLDEHKKLRKSIEENLLNAEKDSIQYNCQDLDQEQKVDVNPVQLNAQNIHVHVENNNDDYSGKITGITYVEKSGEIAANVDIFLFFGNESLMPVYKTNSDNNGNFIIDEIPPGYYNLYAENKEKLRYQSHYIKVLPGGAVHLPVLLRKKSFFENN